MVRLRRLPPVGDDVSYPTFEHHRSFLSVRPSAGRARQDMGRLGAPGEPDRSPRGKIRPLQFVMALLRLQFQCGGGILQMDDRRGTDEFLADDRRLYAVISFARWFVAQVDARSSETTKVP